MKTIVISDITLRIAEKEKAQMTFREKLQFAKALDASGMDAIELPAPDGTKEQAVILRTIAGSVRESRAAVPVGATAESVRAAWDCVRDAQKPCLQVVLPISTVQMEYQFHAKAPKMLEKIAALCKEAAALCPCVEFVAADATRAEEGFAAQCCQTAAENGASAVTLCDDSGVFLPEDYTALVGEIKAVCSVPVYIQPSDSLSLAAAGAVCAIRAGAEGVKTAVGSPDCLTADTAADLYRAKGEALGVTCRLDTTAIHRTLSAFHSAGAESTMTAPAEPAEETEAVLHADAGEAEILGAVKELGYELTPEDQGKVVEEFRRMTEKKGSVGMRELEAIVATAAMQVPSTYHLVSYVVNSGNIITATANVTLEKNGERISGVSIGDGPIDAAFHAIEQIIGHHYELDDFGIQAVTKGREAVGSSLIRLRDGGRLYAGNGISTDVIGACIRAYLNALNKIVYEEN